MVRIAAKIFAGAQAVLAPVFALPVFVLLALASLPGGSARADTESDFDAAVQAATDGDYTTAAVEFSRLAEQGDARGQNGLGLLYANGLGVTQDLAKAVQLFQLAAKQGYPSAQNNLGEAYYYGRGVERDPEQARQWFQLAAEQQDSAAQKNLALMYANGKTVGQSYAKALAWLRKSAHQGNASAQVELGHMYRAGDGVERDYERAYAWYGVAAAGGEPYAPTYTEQMEALLTERGLDRARRLARDLFQRYGSDMR